ncbi:ABC transporter permease [Niallia circulans]|uniref:ABC transporter permease n=1 Tax=Niallia circulans TaxID=1397 RepID=A0A553SI20_NIACI|nr:ABC transporter permease [Niallia circulans]TRZ36636.1 ABC transporter permease [Niallia circulans]
MRIRALVIRILQQVYRDKRTVAMMILAPIFILTMVHLVFNSDSYEPEIGLIDAPSKLQEALPDNATSIYKTEAAAKKDLAAGKIDGYLKVDSTIHIMVEGSDPSVSKAVVETLRTAFPSTDAAKVDALYGETDMSQFDSFGPILLGFFAFFFVFLVAGVSFLRERTSGTLERLLSSPVRRWELVLSYVIGFGLFTMIQSAIIVFYAVYILGMMNEGSILLVLLTTLILSLTALTLGILLSTFAKNELQMIQFIPIIVVPQVFFSGLFPLETISRSISWISTITPLYYAGHALKDVMIRGKGLGNIAEPLLILLCFSLLFIFINIAALKRYRKI